MDGDTQTDTHTHLGFIFLNSATFKLKNITSTSLVEAINEPMIREYNLQHTEYCETTTLICNILLVVQNTRHHLSIIKVRILTTRKSWQLENQDK